MEGKVEPLDALPAVGAFAPFAGARPWFGGVDDLLADQVDPLRDQVFKRSRKPLLLPDVGKVQLAA